MTKRREKSEREREREREREKAEIRRGVGGDTVHFVVRLQAGNGIFCHFKNIYYIGY